MQLVLDTQGLMLKQHNRSFLVVSKTRKARISPQRVSSIAVTASCMLTTTALRLAIKHKIPVHIIGPSGDVEGTLWSPHLVGLASQRKAQVYWMDSKDALLWLLEIIHLKITRQEELLQKLELTESTNRLAESRIKLVDLQKEKSAQEIINLTDFNQVRQTIFGLEGTAARVYWQALSTALPKGWQFGGRSRRPAKDSFNACLNYLYGMLYGAVEVAILSAGLDPYMGVLHTENYTRSAFTFDCIEPFRPWIDALIIDAFLAELPQMTWFTPKGEGWWLAKKGKSWVIPAFNDFLVRDKLVGDRSTTVRNQLHTFTGLLANRMKESNSQIF